MKIDYKSTEHKYHADDTIDEQQLSMNIDYKSTEHKYHTDDTIDEQQVLSTAENRL